MWQRLVRFWDNAVILLSFWILTSVLSSLSLSVQCERMWARSWGCEVNLLVIRIRVQIEMEMWIWFCKCVLFYFFIFVPFFSFCFCFLIFSACSSKSYRWSCKIRYKGYIFIYFNIDYHKVPWTEWFLYKWSVLFYVSFIAEVYYLHILFINIF